MKQIIICFLLFSIFIVFSEENIADNRSGSSDNVTSDTSKSEEVLLDNGLITLEISEHFDKKYYKNVKDYYFYRDDKRISLEEFEEITGDNSISANNERIENIKKNGFTAAIVLGCISTAFLIPSVVFLAVQTNYYNIEQMYDNNSGAFSYYEENYYRVFLPGLISIILTMVSTIATFIDLAVTFGLVGYHSNNEKLYYKVIEDYNRNLRKKKTVIPDISYNSGGGSDGLEFTLKVNL